MKKIFFIFLIIILSLFFGLNVKTVSAQNTSSRASALQEKQIAKLREKGNLMIEKRVTELNALSLKINRDLDLTIEEKASLSADINSAVAGLNSLKEKIAADSEVTVLRTDVRKIVTNYRINTIVTPKTRILVVVNRLENLNEKIIKLIPQLQTLIADLKSQGKDTTAMQSALDEINSSLQIINNKLASVKSSVMSVTIASTDEKRIFTQARKDLASVRNEFASIRNNLTRLKTAYKTINKSASNSADAK